MTVSPLLALHRRLAAVLMAVLIAVCAGQSGAADMPDEQQAQNYIRKVADDFFDVLRNPDLDEATRRAELKALMLEEVAVAYIAKLSLGRHGKPHPGMSEAERQAFDAQLEEYQALFPDFLFEKMYDLVLSKFKDATVEVTGATPIRKTDIYVHTTIHRPGAEPVLADWRVRTTPEGKLKIIDVKAEGVSMTITQRDDFASIIGGSRDLGKVLAHMRAQIAANQVDTEPSAVDTEPSSGNGEKEADTDSPA
ncbi:MAG: ABC transporter substrate-binding protein [Alphaproteobacteria bacterium]|nr:MAG: ABC transporter substrate-binding protein [Alphaproteobacteria bacterium]